MPALTVGEDISFYYTDSGPQADSEYTTLVFIHGHTFHSGVFQRLVPFAPGRRLRIICLNRREYPESTPYSTDERKTILDGSDTDRAEFLHQQGVLIALFIHVLIQELSLPEKVGVVGWSMGTIFSVAALASIDRVPETTRARLRTHVKHFFLLDPPSQGLGIPNPPNAYNPLWDDDLPPETRGPAFGKWVSSYFHHEDLLSRDISLLSMRAPDASKTPTIESLTHEELSSVASFESGSRVETILVESEFRVALAAQTHKALFDSDITAMWGNPQVWHLHGEATTWNSVYAAWMLEEKARTSKDVRFKPLSGANHFFMWEEPERFLDVLMECMGS
ncbi:hypothetical protein LshimejAT787_1602570 [Lyophyllum shimeji]|uniref:AB hydrolase-1 domain-containing protein n=1 Tax=Lyophyllum shimeji TaxID=47721 RepID=A0A9P3PZY3_LYOSH|nr:hypothetical protein LshimejAT787_1602570 [Lyophyllum shimeji]